MNNLETFTRRCKNMRNFQRDMVLFLRKNAGHWNSFASDHDTVEVVCSLVNLGIAEIRGSQMILKSREKADHFLALFKG